MDDAFQHVSDFVRLKEWSFHHLCMWRTALRLYVSFILIATAVKH